MTTVQINWIESRTVTSINKKMPQKKKTHHKRQWCWTKKFQEFLPKLSKPLGNVNFPFPYYWEVFFLAKSGLKNKSHWGQACVKPFSSSINWSSVQGSQVRRWNKHLRSSRFLMRVLSRRPIQVIFMSGSFECPLAIGLSGIGGGGTLSKPPNCLGNPTRRSRRCGTVVLLWNGLGLQRST